MPDFWLDQPRNIVQSSPRDCWAATMEAWLEIVPGKTAWSQDELFLMAAEKGLVWDNDTLEMNALVKKGIPVIAKEVGKLSTKRHVYLVYHPPSAPDDLAHAVVCYGISTARDPQARRHAPREGAARREAGGPFDEVDRVVAR
jgi:hypothetical protein